MANQNYAKKDLKNVNDGKVTSEESSHPVGTTLGTIGGAAAGIAGSMIAGAAAGAAIGPVGAAVGAVIGAGIGAGAGHEIAAQVNPKAEDLFWRENYSSRPYAVTGVEYDVYQPAFHYGIESYTKHKGRNFDEIESDLGNGWHKARGESNLEWSEAKLASRDAYSRLSDSNK